MAVTTRAAGGAVPRADAGGEPGAMARLLRVPCVGAAVLPSPSAPTTLGGRWVGKAAMLRETRAMKLERLTSMVSKRKRWRPTGEEALRALRDMGRHERKGTREKA